MIHCTINVLLVCCCKFLLSSQSLAKFEVFIHYYCRLDFLNNKTKKICSQDIFLLGTFFICIVALVGNVIVEWIINTWVILTPTAGCWMQRQIVNMNLFLVWTFVWYMLDHIYPLTDDRILYKLWLERAATPTQREAWNCCDQCTSL